MSLSLSLWGLVIIFVRHASDHKKGGLSPQAARGVRIEPSRLGRGGLPG